MTTSGRPQAIRVLASFAVSILALLACAGTAQAAPPANDDFAAAVSLPAELFAGKEGNNLEATKETGEPNHAGNPGGHSVWFKWTPTSSGPIGIQSSSCFGVIDTLIAVYTGSSVSALTPVASNATEFPPTCSFSELPQAEFEATAGTTYWIAVDGRNGAEGTFQLQFKHPPSNDDFADALTLGTQPPQSTFGTNRLSGKQAGEPDHAGDPGGHSVWFSWTPNSSERVRISACGDFSKLDAVLAVYTGSELASLDEVASNDEGARSFGALGCNASGSEVSIDSVAGTTYKIAVDGASGTTGRFTLQIQGHPANDEFDSAQALTPTLPAFGSGGNNEFATKQAGEPNHASDPGGQSVWYSWTPASSGPVRVSTCSDGGLMDTLLAVYTGTAVGTLTPVAANDDGPRSRCGDRDSELDLTVTAGTTYRIAVDGKDGSTGRFSLSLDGPAAHDSFADPQLLGSGPSISVAASNALAGKEAGEPNHAANPGGHSVWFLWTAPETGPYVVSACPYFENSPDTLLAVYAGDALGSLTPVAAADDSPSACQEAGSEVTIAAVAGTSYRIAVDSKGADDGIFSLEIKGKPSNDSFARPQDLGPGSSLLSGGSTRFASKEAGEPDHAGNPGGHSVWFSWTPAKSGLADLYACGHKLGIDTLLAVYTGSGVNALTPVAANDDAAIDGQSYLCEPGNGNSEVTFQVAAGTTYWIAVDTKDSEGRFSLLLEGVAANDDFEDAQEPPAGLPAFASATTKLASVQSGEPAHAGDPGGHSVWFTWTATASEPVSAQTCTFGGDFDTVLAVYTGSTVGGLTPVAGADDGQGRMGCWSTDSAAQFSAVAGTTYRIAVDGKGGSVGTFQLILEGRAANDDFGSAKPLGGVLPTMNGPESNRFADKQVGEPDHAGDPGGSSTWFKWTAPRSGLVSVDTCESDFDTLLAVYTGASLGGLTLVQGNDEGGGSCSPGSKLSFSATANTTYRIAVDGKGGAQGTFELHVEEPRRNDDFESAETIPGSAGWYWPGSNLLATKQAGEPDHAGDAGGHSVWFSWMPRKSWAVEVDVCAGSFEPLIGVYTGDAVDGLTPVATTDAGSGECDEGRSVGFTTVPGTTYRIAVDGAAGDEGHFLLHLRAPGVLQHTLVVSRSGSGVGTVDASLNGISCGSICSHDFEEGTAMVLTAKPVAGSTFAGWSGGGCAGTGPCQVAVNGDTNVTATFELLPGGGGDDGGSSGGGTSGASGGGGSAPVGSTPPPAPGPKPLRCKRGFKKKRVHGKARCVKKKKGKRRRHR